MTSLAGGAGSPATPPPSPGWSGKLALSVQQQVSTNWCWAAVSASVASFYRPESPQTQCDVANASLGRTDCCGPAGSQAGSCNQPFYLDIALTVTGHFAGMRAAKLSVADIAGEISAGRPIGCRLGWPGGSGHFLAIVGVDQGASGTAYIDVSDPIFLDTRIAYDAFEVQYQGGGTWTHSYFTHNPTVAVALGGAGPSADPLDPYAIGA